jgi:hypothetical protein
MDLNIGQVEKIARPLFLGIRGRPAHSKSPASEITCVGPATRPGELRSTATRWRSARPAKGRSIAVYVGHDLFGGFKTHPCVAANDPRPG